MKNVPVTKEALASLIKSVLDQARIADPTYTATTNDYINAINKIGDVVSFEYEVPTELTWIDGEKMPYGSTIEEVIEDFLKMESLALMSHITQHIGKQPIPIPWALKDGGKQRSTIPSKRL